MPADYDYLHTTFCRSLRPEIGCSLEPPPEPFRHGSARRGSPPSSLPGSNLTWGHVDRVLVIDQGSRKTLSQLQFRHIASSNANCRSVVVSAPVARFLAAKGASSRQTDIAVRFLYAQPDSASLRRRFRVCRNRPHSVKRTMPLRGGHPLDVAYQKARKLGFMIWSGLAGWPTEVENVQDIGNWGSSPAIEIGKGFATHVEAVAALSLCRQLCSFPLTS